MPNKMLIDATHPEETRVVVLRGQRVEEFDFESASRKQLRGNIYLAKVTRVEPSLQAAFVDYGGNRHGFLAFSEIHPDYYRIPIADREALLAELDRDDGEDGEAESERPRGRSRRGGRSQAQRDPEPQLPGAVEEPIDSPEAPVLASAEEPTRSEAEDEDELGTQAESEPGYEEPLASEAAESEESERLPDALPLVVGEGWSVSSEPVSLF